MSITVTTVHNPFNEFANTTEVVEYQEGQSLLFYLPQLAHRDGVSWVVAVNGVVIEAAFEHVIIENGDIIAVSAKTNGMLAGAIATWATGAATASAALTAGFGTFLAYSAVYAGSMLVIGYGMSMLASALAPDPAAGGGAGTDVEQTYGWDSLAPALAEGNPIPLIFGTNKVAGQVINEFVEISGNDQYLYSLMALCDHEVDSITDVRINNQPAAYYQDVTTDTRLGTFADTLIDGFNEIVEQKNYGDTLEKDVAVVKQTDGNNVEKIIIYIVAPQGLYYSNNEGGLSTRTAEFVIRYRAVGAASWTLLSSYSITDNTTETIRKKYEIDDLEADQYEVQVTRTNEEESSHRGSSEIQLYSVQEIIKDKLTYPGLAKYAVKALATGQLSGARPIYTCVVTRNTVPVHDGTEWTTGLASNPAWICYNLLNQRVPYTRLIYSEFLAWANHCDEDISDAGDPAEKRFELSEVVNQNKSLWDQVQEIARYADATIVRKGTKYGVFVDKQDTVVSHLFTMGNINRESFSIQYLPQKDRANAVEIEYTDPDRAYTRQVVMLMSSDYNDPDTYSKKASVRVAGAIPYNQAVRMGIRQINNNTYINRVITFEADIDSFACTIGDLFYFAHEAVDYERGVSGRIVSATAGSVTLDRSVVIESGVTYSILVRIQDDTIVEKTVTNAPGTASVLTLNSNFTTTPESYCVYSFGVATTVKKTYRLINLTKSSDFTRQITGIEYIGEIYTEGSDIIIENPSWVTPTQEALNVRLKEILVWGSDGTYASSIHVSWHPSHREQGKAWAVWLQDTDTSQAAVKAAVVSNLHTVIGSQFLTIDHTYRVTICPDGDGLYETTGDNTNYADITLLGKLAPPSDVSGFTGTWNSLTRSVNLTWTHISDIDFDHYEIRKKTTGTPGWDDATKVAMTVDNAKSFLVDNNTAETQTYYIKAVDTSGIYSETAAEAAVAVDTSETPLTVPTGLTVTSSSSFTDSGEQVVTMRISWDALVADDLRDYAVRIERQLGTNEAGNAMNPVEIYTTDETVFDYTAMPSTRYWVSVRAIDTSSGRTAWASQVEHVTCGDTVAPDDPTSLTASALWSSILIKCYHSGETDLARFDVYRNTTDNSAGATIVGAANFTRTGDFAMYTDVPPDNSTYYYWAKAIDTSGNASGFSNSDSAAAPGIGDGAITSVMIGEDQILAPHILAGEIGADHIAANAITAAKIDVDQLSAISANLGTIVAGIIQDQAGSSPKSWMDLANQTMSLGNKLLWDGVSLLLNGWNSTADSTRIDGGFIHAGSQIMIGNMDGASDYCLINDGDITFARHFGSGIGHQVVRSLKQITSGSCTNNTLKELPGYWANKPIISVSPRSLQTYSQANAAYDQSILCPDPEAVEISTGKYGFTPTAQLVLTNGSATNTINVVGTTQSIPIGTTTATTAEHTVAEANTVQMDLALIARGYYNSIQRYGGSESGYWWSCKKYQIKATLEIRYYTDSAWTTWDDDSRGAVWITNGQIQMHMSISSATAIEKIQARLTLTTTTGIPYTEANVADQPYQQYTVETDPGTDNSLIEVEIESYQSQLSGFSILATGDLNYIAIEGHGDITDGFGTADPDPAETIVLQVGSPQEQIEKSGYTDTITADEGNTQGMQDGDLFIQHEE